MRRLQRERKDEIVKEEWNGRGSVGIYSQEGGGKK